MSQADTGFQESFGPDSDLQGTSLPRAGKEENGDHDESRSLGRDRNRRPRRVVLPLR